MAIGAIDYNRQSEYGRPLHDAVVMTENGLAALTNMRDTLVQMKDGANLTQYAVTKFGTPDVATATAMLNEIDAALQAIASGMAAMNQMFDRLR